MSMKKSTETTISYSFKQEIFKSLKRRKIEVIGLTIAFLLVIFDFLAYSKSLYSVFMLVGITVYVIYYFAQSVYLYTRMRITLKLLDANPDFKEFKEQMQQLTPEMITQLQQIQEAEAQRIQELGQTPKSILEE